MPPTATGSTAPSSYSYNIGTYDVTTSQYVAVPQLQRPHRRRPARAVQQQYEQRHLSAASITTRAPPTAASTASSRAMATIRQLRHFLRHAALRQLAEQRPEAAAAPRRAPTRCWAARPRPAIGNSITRNADATVFLPSENEWYKAAYYNPSHEFVLYLYADLQQHRPNRERPHGGAQLGELQ